MSDQRNPPDVDGVEVPPEIAQLLRQVYLPGAAEAWLRGRNAHLEGGRPIDLLKLGDVASVTQALMVEIEGGIA